jgi:hypothetical protein
MAVSSEPKVMHHCSTTATTPMKTAAAVVAVSALLVAADYHHQTKQQQPGQCCFMRWHTDPGSTLLYLLQSCSFKPTPLLPMQTKNCQHNNIIFTHHCAPMQKQTPVPVQTCEASSGCVSAFRAKTKQLSLPLRIHARACRYLHGRA